jgi:hypothetical protein
VIRSVSSATPTGLEPAASAVTGRRANQLRYGARCGAVLPCWASLLKRWNSNPHIASTPNRDPVRRWWHPQRDSNPCYRRERAGSWAARRWGPDMLRESIGAAPIGLQKHRPSPFSWGRTRSCRVSVAWPGSSVGTSVRLKSGRSAVRPRPWPPAPKPQTSPLVCGFVVPARRWGRMRRHEQSRDERRGPGRRGREPDPGTPPARCRGGRRAGGPGPRREPALGRESRQAVRSRGTSTRGMPPSPSR